MLVGEHTKAIMHAAWGTVGKLSGEILLAVLSHYHGVLTERKRIMNAFAATFEGIAKGAVWLGKKVVFVEQWFPKVVKLLRDAPADADKVYEPLKQVIVDVDKLGEAVVKDCGESLTAFETLLSAIADAAHSDGLNIQNDMAVVSAVSGLIASVRDKAHLADVFAALKQLVSDYDALGAAAKQAIHDLEADVQ